MTKEERYEYVPVDPRLARALDRRGVKGFQSLLLELAGTQELDEPTKKGLFWQLIGYMASDAGRAAARPWIFLTVILMLACLVLGAGLYNLLFLMALGLI